MSAGSDARFIGGIPALYESLLVPMIFAEPARSLAAWVAQLQPKDILETATGTGVLTRELLKLPDARVVATDLNAAMLDTAQSKLSSDRVRWQVADALALPFDDQTYDVVACQFGVMFFPDKVAGFVEAARVLRPGGSFVFSVWDRLENNAVANVVTEALCAAAPSDSLDFMRRTPHAYFDVNVIESDLRAAGYEQVRIEPIDGTSRATAQDGAVACCQGTPLRGAIEQSGLSLERATDIAAEALEATFGAGPFDAPTRWFQLAAGRPTIIAARSSGGNASAV